MSITIYTVGHGRRSQKELLALLAQAGIKQLADVRAYPRSARHPWFNDVNLKPSIEQAGVAYHWLGSKLGGRRENKPGSHHTALKPNGLRAFADHMETPAFRNGIDSLVTLAAQSPTAVMCAESSPSHCHRGLIADFLTQSGIVIIHLLGESERQLHVLHEAARKDAGRLIYDQTTQRRLTLE